MPTLLPWPRARFWNEAGTAPLVGGKLYAYWPGTLDLKPTYTDSTGDAENENPVILDAAGEADIWISGVYDMILTDRNDVQQWTVQNLSAGRVDIIPAGGASVTDYGAVGDGFTDDLQAFEDALADNTCVFVPSGNYYLSDSIYLNESQVLYGNADTSVLQFRNYPLNKSVIPPTYPSDYAGVVIQGSYATLKDVDVVGAAIGVLLLGDEQPVVQCLVSHVNIWDCRIALKCDGGDDTNFPTYWNEIYFVLAMRMRDIGFYLTREPSGDTANANKFRHCRAYSNTAPMANEKIGFYAEAARYGNAFIDCEANLHPDSVACFQFGPDASQNYIVNFTAEALGPVNGISIEAGAGDDGYNSIINYFHTTAGASIYDPSHARQYYALFAGFPDRALLPRTRIAELYLEQLNYESVFLDPGAAPADQVPDPEAPVQLLSSFGDPFNFDLEDPLDASGRVYFIKKIDLSDNIITIRIQGDTTNGPDGANFQLTRENDYVVAYSNGAEWLIFATNRIKQGASFFDSTDGTTYTVNADVYFNLIDAGVAPVDVAMPDPADAQSVGKTVIVKRNNSGANAVTVLDIERGNNVPLNSQDDYLMLFCNGADWWIISERR